MVVAVSVMLVGPRRRRSSSNSRRRRRRRLANVVDGGSRGRGSN